MSEVVWNRVCGCELLMAGGLRGLWRTIVVSIALGVVRRTGLVVVVWASVVDGKHPTGDLLHWDSEDPMRARARRRVTRFIIECECSKLMLEGCLLREMILLY